MRVCHILLAWLLAGCAVYSYGLEIHARQQDGSTLSVTVRDINFPASIVDQELTNGLPNRIDVVMDVLADDKKKLSTMASHTVTYDLWDEVYTIDTVAPHRSEQTSAATKNELLEYLSTANFINLNLPPASGDTLRIQAEVIFNPVQKDRIEKVKQWLDKRGSYNRNSVDAATDAPASVEDQALNASVGGVRSSGPRFQKLFDQILEQYAESKDVVAQWRSGKAETTINLNDSDTQ